MPRIARLGMLSRLCDAQDEFDRMAFSSHSPVSDEACRALLRRLLVPPARVASAEPAYARRRSRRGGGAVSSAVRRGKRAASPERASAASAFSMATNWSSEALLSVSVGSISSAPCTTSGKYIVIG